MKAPRWSLVVFVGIQLLIPTVLLVVRWLALDGGCILYGWQMYACGG